MNDCVGLPLNVRPLVRCLEPSVDAASNTQAADCTGALNGIAPRGAKPTATARCSPYERPATRLGSRAWVSIVVAVIAVVSVLAAELWLARAAPALSDSVAPTVVAEVSATLGRVAEVPLLIVPTD